MTSKTLLNELMEKAAELDANDPLSSFREQFHIPQLEDGSEEIYFVGNSLGLQPKLTASFLESELENWRKRGVRGHFEGDFPWMPYHEFLTETMADLVGARQEEVVMMNSLTVNLHLMMATFYRPEEKRGKILIEQHAFPSDHYAAESQIRWHGNVASDDLVLLRPRDGEDLIDTNQICAAIDYFRESLAMVLLPGVQYYTGQFFDIETITEEAHKHGIFVGWDLAHAVGNVPLRLHDWNVDFAVWCSYKYLNSGPGSVGGCFIHHRHATNPRMKRLAGWWGQDKQTRFQMGDQFNAIPTAEGWQLSNPPILSLAAIRSSMEIFKQAGGISPLRTKSLKLTTLFSSALKQVLGDRVEVITPADDVARGCQLSIKITKDGVDGKDVHEKLESAGVRTDWREPNVIRAAPVPLYNTFSEVVRFVQKLDELL